MNSSAEFCTPSCSLYSTMNLPYKQQRRAFRQKPAVGRVGPKEAHTSYAPAFICWCSMPS